MTQFKFRLETLLKLREGYRDECRGRLEQAEEAEAILNEQSEELREERKQIEAGASQAASPGEIDVDALVDFRRYGLVLQVQLGQLAEQRKLVEAEVERRRNELTEADREVKVLEKLKERQLEAFRREEQAQEIKTLDEIAGRMSAVRRSETRTTHPPSGSVGRAAAGEGR